MGRCSRLGFDVAAAGSRQIRDFLLLVWSLGDNDLIVRFVTVNLLNHDLSTLGRHLKEKITILKNNYSNFY